MYWTKGNRVIQSSQNVKLMRNGSLFLSNVSESATSGTYTCVAIVGQSRVNSTTLVTVVGTAAGGLYDVMTDEATDIVIVSALDKANKAVDKAVNATAVKYAPSAANKSLSDSVRSLRYPDEKSRNLVKGNEVYELALQVYH